MTLLFDKYKAFVGTSWNQGVIAFSTNNVVNGNEQNKPNDYPGVVFYQLNSPVPPSSTKQNLVNRDYNAYLEIQTENPTDLEKMLEGHLELFKDQPDIWRSGSYDEEEKRAGVWSGKLYFTEDKNIAYNSW